MVVRMTLRNESRHLTKKKARDFLKKIFGSCPSDIWQNESGTKYCVKYGKMTAECQMTNARRLCLVTYIDTVPLGELYFDPESYEVDYEYTMKKQCEVEDEQ